MKTINKPLIIGASHHNTYGLVRCFGEAGVPVDLILYDCDDSYIGKSVYVEHLFYCENEIEVNHVVEMLLEDNTTCYTIFAATDAIASMMDQQYKTFQGKCNFFNSGQTGRLTHFMDKATQTETAEEAGLVVPKTMAFSKGERLRFSYFPCVVKPLASIDGGKRIVICHNQNELDACSKDFADMERILVQQYVEREQEIVMLGVAVNDEIIVPGYIIKHRDVKGGTTYSSTAPISMLDSDFVECARRFVKSLHYEGLFGIEFIKCGNQYYFIEINLRNDATTYSLAVAGVNLPMMYYQAVAQKQTFHDVKQNVRSIFSIVELVDFRNVLHRRIGLFKWLRQRKHAECKYFASKVDPQPFRVARKEFVRHLLGRFLL